MGPRGGAAGAATPLDEPHPAFVVTVGAGLFPGSGYDPAPVLTRVTQPVLALWGEDRLGSRHRLRAVCRSTCDSFSGLRTK